MSCIASLLSTRAWRRAQGTEGGDEHDALLRNASLRLKRLNDIAGPLLADRDRLREQVAQLEADQLRSVERAGDMAEEIERDRATIARVQEYVYQQIHYGHPIDESKLLGIVGEPDELSAVVVGGEATPTETGVELTEDEIRIEKIPAPWQTINMGDRGARVTHLPTGIVVEAINARAYLNNASDAIEQMKRKLAPIHAAAVPVPAETPETKLLRDIFTDPAQRKSTFPRGTLEGQDWAKPEQPVSTPLGQGVIQGIRFDDAGYEWWSVRVAGNLEVFRPDELDQVPPGGHRIDDEGDQG